MYWLLFLWLGCAWHTARLDPVTNIGYQVVGPKQGIQLSGGLAIFAFPLPTEPEKYADEVTARIRITAHFLEGEGRTCGTDCGVYAEIRWDEYVTQAEFDAALQFVLTTYAPYSAPIYIRARYDGTPRRVHLLATVSTGYVRPM